MPTPVTDTSDREFFSTRVLDAPRDLVWSVWTDPTHIAKWWGPDGFTNTIKEMAVKPGGTWQFTMHGPDGRDWPNVIRYVDVVQPERLVYHHGDEDGDPNQQFLVTVTFDDLGNGKTKLTMRMLCASAEQKQQLIRDVGAVDGQKQTLDKLEAYLAAL